MGAGRPILKSMLDDSAAVARLFVVLADPNRRRMVEQLSHGPASVSALAKPLGVSLAAVVQHIQHLEDSGLVRTEKVGRIRTCYLRPEGLRPAEQWLVERRRASGCTLESVLDLYASIHRSIR